MKPAVLVMADPPWKFGDALPGPGRGAANHYSCMSTVAIKAHPLPPLADNCLLMLWRVSSMQAEALQVMQAWGFALKSEIVWNKLTAHGKQHFGMGRYVRAAHETCLLATRGRVTVADHSVRSTFSTVAPPEHSTKPNEIFDIAERLIPLERGPHVELFGRRARPGWYVFGNQVYR